MKTPNIEGASTQAIWSVPRRAGSDVPSNFEGKHFTCFVNPRLEAAGASTKTIGRLSCCAESDAPAVIEGSIINCLLYEKN